MQLADRKLPFAVAVLLLIWGPLAAEDSPSTERIREVAARFQEEQRIPGLSLAVARDNQIVFETGLGLADVESQVAATADTRYRTASIAKSMTAVTVLSLMESGALDLDAPVQTYCPKYPEKRWPVTSRQLLGHLGGVRHYKSAAEARSTKHFFSQSAAIRTFDDDPLLHEPGTKYHYTTFGYNLLGGVVEGAAKQSFLQALQERVLTPAGMQHTVIDDVYAVVPHRAAGYIRPKVGDILSLGAVGSLKPGKLYNAPLHDTSMKVPGGGLLSTAGDLVRFALAVNQGKLLKGETCEQMWTSQQTADGKTTGYGMGWRVREQSGHKVVSHTGGQSGVSTVLAMWPKQGVAVAIMCNLQRVSLTPLAKQIGEQLVPPKAPPAEPAPKDANAPVDYSAAIERLEAAVKFEVEQKQLPAFSIALVDGNRQVWAEGFGHQDTEQKQPANKDTLYRVGSVSKLFTDIALMQLVEQGKLKLDAPVTEYLPEFKPNNPFGKPITLRQLMTHRSGLVRESPIGHYFDPDEPSLGSTVASLNQTSLVYPPDTKTKYSNAAVAVVGAVLERALDTTHPEYVRRKILAPLGMTRSSFERPDDASTAAVGWMRTYDGRRFEAPDFQLGTGPAGNLYSSVVDLSQFLSCLFRGGAFPFGDADGRILEEKTLKSMWQPVRDANGKPQSFGIGFHIQKLDGELKVGHGGAVYGFSTQLEALPNRSLGVAAASSLDGSNGVVSRLADYALRLMVAVQDGKPLPKYRTTVPVDPERTRSWSGTYRDAEGFAQVTQLDGKLYLQRGVFRYELRAAADTGAILIDDEVGFGSVVQLQGKTLVVDGRKFQRVPDQPPADTPAAWRGLIGEYGWDHNTLYILEEAGQLYALIEWFYYYPLKAVDENTFLFPEGYGLYHGEGLKFKRDARGVATEVVAAEVVFKRREVGTEAGETFRITPVRPIDELRETALAASPPQEPGEFRTSELVDLTTLDKSIKLDIRYATTNNFTGAVFYKQPRAFMQRPAAEAVVRAHRRLKARGLGLMIHDAYRPWHVTKMFWDATPSDLKDFVANPQNGSRHNRGCAVDLTLYDLETGKPIPMVAGYDEFSPRAFPLYPGGDSRQRWYRQLLRETMEAEGFSIYEYEWWHFDYRDWKKYRIGNLTFEAIE